MNSSNSLPTLPSTSLSCPYDKLLDSSTMPYLRSAKNLLGFSGGVDSSALFFLLQYKEIDFDVCMVDYQIRSQSYLEGAYARWLCQKYNKRFFFKRSPRIYRNFESRAREVRFNFFEEIISENGYENLILAHQLNDRLEWFLMQFLRGGGLRSLLGFDAIEERNSKKINYRIIRPMWESNKQEILKFLKENQIHFFQDESNLDARFFRNFIRKNYATPLLSIPNGIKNTFRYLRKEKLSLYHNFKINNIGGVRIIPRSKEENTNIYRVDHVLKIMGYVMSSKQRKQIQKNTFDGVLHRFFITCNEDWIFIAQRLEGDLIPSLKLDKKFKNFCRKNQIPPRIRIFFYQAIQLGHIDYAQLAFLKKS